MSLHAEYARYRLHFRETAITSRAAMNYKDTYFVRVTDECGRQGWGECALFRGLGADDRPDYEQRLALACRDIEGWHAGDELPVDALYGSIRFGLSTALRDLANDGRRVVFPSPWSSGNGSIAINGLIWMGTAEAMTRRIEQKLADGFGCLKLKIGGIDFDSEVAILAEIRRRFSPDVLELRLDANGAFSPDNAMQRLELLARFGIHSIEQPVKAGQLQLMSRLCKESPIDIALDEELIGVVNPSEMADLLDTIHPAYVILKPSLCGGFELADKWIGLADERGIGWWATSALESNVGLNAIAQWIASKYGEDGPLMPQGLGTGALYTNNIVSPLELSGERLSINPQHPWIMPSLNWQH